MLATTKDPLEFNQFGATNGGSIVKNKLFLLRGLRGTAPDRGTTLVRTVETPEFRNLVASQFPNSIGNFLFKNFPSPAPTSNIRDIGRPVPGLQTQNVLNNPSVATNPNYTATGGGLYRNVLQGTPDGIPDIGTANVTLPENDHRQSVQHPSRSGVLAEAPDLRPLHLRPQRRRRSADDRPPRLQPAGRSEPATT